MVEDCGFISIVGTYDILTWSVISSHNAALFYFDSLLRRTQI